jgi:hypothetical protein
MATVKITYNSTKADQLRAVGPIANQAALRVAAKVQERARANIRAAGRVNTGAMIRGVVIRRGGTAASLNAMYDVVASAPWSIYQEEGTRAHGPVRAKVLRFQIRGKGPVIFTKWVRGVTPAHFMRNALNAARVEDAVATVLMPVLEPA